MDQSSTGGGALVLTNSSVINNHSTGQGGAIGYYWGGPLSITNSSITGNSAGGVGGVAYFYGSGGTGNYPITINNSTLANNTSGSSGGAFAIEQGGGTFSATGATFTGNVAAGSGGAIWTSGSSMTFTLDNSIFAGNTASSANEISTTNSATCSYNAIDDVTGFTSYSPGTGDLSQASSTVAALNLQPLANATGPNGTFMVAKLGAGSTAIDVGDPTLAGTTDQLGTTRPVGSGVDIGAIEKVNAVAPTVSSVVVGAGTGQQRSEVRSIVVTFDQGVSFSGSPASAFQLLHVSSNGTPINVLMNNLQTAVTTNGSGQTVVTLTFTTTGNAAQEVDPVSAQNGGAPSLGDGQWQLTILSSNVSGPGGNLAGGGPGGNYVTPAYGSAGNTVQLYRLFSDVAIPGGAAPNNNFNDGQVDLNDLAAFRNALNTSFGGPGYVAYLDANNDGNIDLQDFAEFRNRLNHTV
jgi:hypothetical protein